MAKMTAELAWQEAQALDQQPPGDVSHIPGQNGLPIIGDALKFFNDPIAYNRSCIEKYGPVFRNRIGPHPSVNLIHPDAQKMLTLDPDQLFSADKGYTPTLGEFFPDGLLLRDFSDHRMHRRIMQSSFKNAMLETYMEDIHRIMRKHTAQWATAGKVNLCKVSKRPYSKLARRFFSVWNWAMTASVSTSALSIWRKVAQPRFDLKYPAQCFIGRTRAINSLQSIFANKFL